MRKNREPKKVLLECNLSLGDIVMLTAAVRELHVNYPGRFITGVRTPYPELWGNNPYITPLEESDRRVQRTHDEKLRPLWSLPSAAKQRKS
jgi:ADP-heptose:LPS heptosyltransferase